jgi:hypothetical protein
MRRGEGGKVRWGAKDAAAAAARSAAVTAAADALSRKRQQLSGDGEGGEAREEGVRGRTAGPTPFLRWASTARRLRSAGGGPARDAWRRCGPWRWREGEGRLLGWGRHTLSLALQNFSARALLSHRAPALLPCPLHGPTEAHRPVARGDCPHPQGPRHRAFFELFSPRARAFRRRARGDPARACGGVSHTPPRRLKRPRTDFRAARPRRPWTV